jgi:peptide/nickel transport system ATP-binding protein
MTSQLLRARDLRISFDGVEVVSGIDLDLAAGECLALVGESGSGKTVTSRSLLGQVPRPGFVSASELVVDDVDARSLSEPEWQRLRGSRIGLVSQDALVSLDPLRTVGREISEVLEVHGRRDGRRLSRAQLDEAVRDELAHVAVPRPELRAKQYAHELSGGLRQRALVASATIAKPRLLIADEPTTALDLTVQAQVIDLLARLKREGTAILLISHDLAVVARIADRIAVMRAGTIVETGVTAQVLAAPEHEYTGALLAATPSMHRKGERLSTLPPLQFGSLGAVDRERVVLSATGIHHSFRQPDGSSLTAVDDVSLELTAGRTLGIVGESGSGKTTLGRILLGLQPPDRGEVLLDGAAWSTLPERERRTRRGGIQAVYQDPLSSFDPRLKVGAILREALALSGVPRQDRRERAVELAGRVGLAEALLGRPPLALSGGQRQRVAIARALARNPRVLICDEPVSALDVSIQAQVLDLFADVQQQLGLAMVFISHDLGVIHHVSDEVLVMKDGVVVERGPAETVFTAPQHHYTQALLSAVPTPGAPT